jgi:hypothetical protein
MCVCVCMCMCVCVTCGEQGCRDPLSDRYNFYVLIETSGSNAEHDMAKLLRFLENGMSSGA